MEILIISKGYLMLKLQITSDKDNVLQILQSAIDSKTKRLEISLLKTKQEILKFEKKYNFSSEQFINSCTAEDLEEEIDYICWMGELQIQQALINELQILNEIEYVI